MNISKKIKKNIISLIVALIAVASYVLALRNLIPCYWQGVFEGSAFILIIIATIEYLQKDLFPAFAKYWAKLSKKGDQKEKPKNK